MKKRNSELRDLESKSIKSLGDERLFDGQQLLFQVWSSKFTLQTTLR